MSEDNLFDSPELPEWDNEGGAIPTEPDPSFVAFLDQEGAEFADQAEEFKNTFGFYHKCRCAQDYAEGKLVEVTECFTEMVGEALESCQVLNAENIMLKDMLAFVLNAATPEASVTPIEEDNAEANDHNDDLNQGV